MSKSNALENGFLLLLFNNDDFLGIGDAGGLLQSVADGNLYVSLHTANPDETGTQATSETAYTNYARQPVARTTAGWTVSGNAATNFGTVTFPTCGASGSTITHVGIGTEVSGAGILLYKMALSSPASLPVVTGVAPFFAAGEIDITED